MWPTSEVAWTAVGQSRQEARLLFPHFGAAILHNKWLILHALSHSPSMWWEDPGRDVPPFGVPMSTLADPEFCFFGVQRLCSIYKLVHLSVLQNVAFAWSATHAWREKRDGPFPMELVPEALLNDIRFARALAVRHETTFGRLSEATRQVREIAFEAVVHWPSTNVPHLPSALLESSSFWVELCSASPQFWMRLPQCLEWDYEVWMGALLTVRVPHDIPAPLDHEDGKFAHDFLRRCHDMKVCPGWRLTRVYLFDPSRTRADEYWLLLLRAARSRQMVHYTLQWMPRHVLHFGGWCFKSFHTRYSRRGIWLHHGWPHWFRLEALAFCSMELASVG